jgi:mannose-6-phosphate isomerase-like protein (cupin superfamily)
MLKNFLYCILLVAMTASIASAQAGAPSGAQKDSAKAPAAATAQPKAEPIIKGGALYFNKEQVEKVFAVAGTFVSDNNNYKIMAGKRTSPGGAEIHGKDTDIFYVLDGTCTIVTGGTLVDEKTTAPDEIRGTAITGGEKTQLAKGDLIVIPHGTPHWMSQVQGTFQYLVVKVR